MWSSRGPQKASYGELQDDTRQLPGPLTLQKRLGKDSHWLGIILWVILSRVVQNQ